MSLSEMGKCIRQAFILDVSYTQVLLLQKHFTYSKGLNYA